MSKNFTPSLPVARISHTLQTFTRRIKALQFLNSKTTLRTKEPQKLMSAIFKPSTFVLGAKIVVNVVLTGPCVNF